MLQSPPHTGQLAVGIEVMKAHHTVRIHHNEGRLASGLEGLAHGIVRIDADDVGTAVVTRVVQRRAWILAAGDLQVIDARGRKVLD